MQQWIDHVAVTREFVQLVLAVIALAGYVVRTRRRRRAQGRRPASSGEPD